MTNHDQQVWVAFVEYARGDGDIDALAVTSTEDQAYRVCVLDAQRVLDAPNAPAGWLGAYAGALVVAHLAPQAAISDWNERMSDNDEQHGIYYRVTTTNLLGPRLSKKGANMGHTRADLRKIAENWPQHHNDQSVEPDSIILSLLDEIDHATAVIAALRSGLVGVAAAVNELVELIDREIEEVE